VRARRLVSAATTPRGNGTIESDAAVAAPAAPRLSRRSGSRRGYRAAEAPESTRPPAHPPRTFPWPRDYRRRVLCQSRSPVSSRFAPAPKGRHGGIDQTCMCSHVASRRPLKRTPHRLFFFFFVWGGACTHQGRPVSADVAHAHPTAAVGIGCWVSDSRMRPHSTQRHARTRTRHTSAPCALCVHCVLHPVSCVRLEQGGLFYLHVCWHL
jgi:hypothetical protein